MSSGHWRTDKRTEPFNPGKCATERAEEYVQTWRRRCYSTDIPDEVPKKVMQSGRAPSYKAIALAILRNDLQLYSLWFSTPSYEKQLEIVERARLLTGAPSPDLQFDLFKVKP